MIDGLFMRFGYEVSSSAAEPLLRRVGVCDVRRLESNALGPPYLLIFKFFDVVLG